MGQRMSTSYTAEGHTGQAVTDGRFRVRTVRPESCTSSTGARFPKGKQEAMYHPAAGNSGYPDSAGVRYTEPLMNPGKSNWRDVFRQNEKQNRRNTGWSFKILRQSAGEKQPSGAAGGI